MVLAEVDAAWHSDVATRSVVLHKIIEIPRATCHKYQTK